MVLNNQQLRELSEIEFTLTSSRHESRYPLFHYYFTDAAHQLSTISIVIWAWRHLPKPPLGTELALGWCNNEGARLGLPPSLLWKLSS